MRKLYFLAGFLLPFFAFSQQHAKKISYGGDQIGFLEHLPSTYNSDGQTTKYPLLIFLHGVGEKGNGTSDLWKVSRIAVPHYIQQGNPMRFYVNGKWHSFIVLSPQCPYKYNSWPSFYVDGLIKYAENNLRVDKSRIYLVGLSMGGGGTWTYASSSQTSAKKLAAIATSSAPAWMSNPCNVAAARLPLYAFHAQDDKVVNVSAINNTVNAILACKPAIRPIKKVWPSGGHNIFDRAFDVSHKWQTPNVYEWLLGYTRGSSPSKPPEVPHNVPPPYKPNIAPVAKTGPAQTIQSFWKFDPLLNGSFSKDADGWIKSVVWTKIYGPSSFKIVSPNKLQTRVQKLVPGKYVFRITITDDRGAMSWANTTVIVNSAPVLRIVGPQAISLPVNWALVLGTPSIDPGGWITSWRWAKISGPAKFSMAGANTGNIHLSNLTAGTYIFRLTVKDNFGGTAYKDYTLRVNNAPKYSIAEGDAKRQSLSTTAKHLPSSETIAPQSMSVHPNPAVSDINVTMNAAQTGRAALDVYDVSGKIVLSVNFDKDQVMQRRSINVSSLTPGMYVLVGTIENEIVSSEQFIKQ